MSDICPQLKKQFEELKGLRDNFDLFAKDGSNESLDKALELK